MRRYLADQAAKIKPRKLASTDIAHALEPVFTWESLYAPAWEIHLTFRLKDQYVEKTEFTAEELKSWLSAKLETGGEDVPLELKGAMIDLGCFVLRTNYRPSVKKELSDRPLLLLTFTFEGAAPLEQRYMRHRPRKRR